MIQVAIIYHFLTLALDIPTVLKMNSSYTNKNYEVSYVSKRNIYTPQQRAIYKAMRELAAKQYFKNQTDTIKLKEIVFGYDKI
jgi:hypothetical protein